MKQVHEYIHLFGDTPEFIANRVDFAVERYNEQLLPPYFRELKKYTDQGAYSWDAPGHMGGVAFLKHPVGMEFHRFFGENLMRSDLGISTAPLGSWLDHIGPPGESERNAARVFGADWTFYVLGGSSTSNQIVGHGVIGQDDIVLVDANCHKSICHSLTVTGARPVYATPTRNGYGMIGLVPIHRFSPQAIKQLVDEEPTDGGRASKELTYAVVTNSTYDGLCYDVNRVWQNWRKACRGCTSMRRGTRTPSFTRSIVAGLQWMCRTKCRTGRRSLRCSQPTRCSRRFRWPRWCISS